MDISSEVWQQITCRRDIQYFHSDAFPTEPERTKITTTTNLLRQTSACETLWLMLRLIMSGCRQPSNCFLSHLKTNKQTKQCSRNRVSDELLSEKRLSCDWRRVPSDPSRPRLEFGVRAVRWTSSRDVSCEIKWLTHSNVLSLQIVAIVPRPTEKNTFPRRRSNPPILTWMSSAALVQAT